MVDANVPSAKSILRLDAKLKYCVTDEPIIMESEFKVKGKIQEELSHKNRYFDLRSRKSGFETIKLICKHVPEKQLMFLASGKVAATIKRKKLQPMQVLLIRDRAGSKEINWICKSAYSI